MPVGVPKDKLVIVELSGQWVNFLCISDVPTSVWFSKGLYDFTQFSVVYGSDVFLPLITKQL